MPGGAPQPVPGLMDVSTDSSGRHVFAVGAPFFLYDYQPPDTNAAPSSFGPGTAKGGVWAGLVTGANNPSSAVATGTIIVRP